MLPGSCNNSRNTVLVFMIPQGYYKHFPRGIRTEGSVPQKAVHKLSWSNDVACASKQTNFYLKTEIFDTTSTREGDQSVTLH